MTRCFRMNASSAPDQPEMQAIAARPTSPLRSEVKCSERQRLDHRLLLDVHPRGPLAAHVAPDCSRLLVEERDVVVLLAFLNVLVQKLLDLYKHAVHRVVLEPFV